VVKIYVPKNRERLFAVFRHTRIDLITDRNNSQEVIVFCIVVFTINRTMDVSFFLAF